MIAVRKALVATTLGALGALGAVAACDVALGLGDLKDRVTDGSAPAETDGAASDGGGAEDAGRRDASYPPATSCQNAVGPGLSDCGPSGNESCCTTLDVEGGSHSRGNDATYPATVSSFRLDRFEVTVGRLRPFIDAAVAATPWKPALGTGKHVHLNGGQGLALIAGGFELGWSTAWNDHIPTTREKWAEVLSCNESNRTWTEAAGAGDVRPANCISWYEAYAFCIWDGGFLPSEAEWSYAATGGPQQRKLPWSDPPSSSVIDCSYANFGALGFPSAPCTDAGPKKVGLTSPKGDGRWRQADLAGNVWEWNLDGYVDQYANPCIDCVDTSTSSSRVLRGGSFASGDVSLFTSSRLSGVAAWSLDVIGFRCARPL